MLLSGIYDLFVTPYRVNHPYSCIPPYRPLNECSCYLSAQCET